MNPKSAKSREEGRIDFVLRRDGEREAVTWAVRTLDIYRRALRAHNHFARGEIYRRGFIESCCALRRFLQAERNALARTRKPS